MFQRLSPRTTIDPGKPWQNGVGESFNGKFRDECLSLEWFLSRAEAKVVIEAWRRHYNEVRPQSSLGYLTPATFAAKLNEQLPFPQRAGQHLSDPVLLTSAVFGRREGPAGQIPPNRLM